MTEIALIGAGKVARKHLTAYRHLGIDVMLSDIDRSKQTVADEFGVRWTPDPHEAMEVADAVDICTPADTHFDLVMNALEAGQDVFVEKPLAGDLAQARVLLEAARDHGQTVMVGYLYRHHPAFQFVREVLEEGLIGEPHFGVFRVGGRGGAAAWKHQADIGGAVNEMLVHMVDLVLWYFDDAVASELWRDLLLPEREIDGETVFARQSDVVALRGIVPDGPHLLIEADLVTPSYMNYVELHGSNGSVWASLLEQFPALLYLQERRGLYDTGMTTRTFDRVDLFERELAVFEDHVNNTREPDHTSIEAAVQTRRVIEEAIDG